MQYSSSTTAHFITSQFTHNTHYTYSQWFHHQAVKFIKLAICEWDICYVTFKSESSINHTLPPIILSMLSLFRNFEYTCSGDLMKGFETSYPTSAYTDNPHAHRNGSLPKYKTEDAKCMQTYILQSWELEYLDDWQKGPTYPSYLTPVIMNLEILNCE